MVLTNTTGSKERTSDRKLVKEGLFLPPRKSKIWYILQRERGEGGIEGGKKGGRRGKKRRARKVEEGFVNWLSNVSARFPASLPSSK